MGHGKLSAQSRLRRSRLESLLRLDGIWVRDLLEAASSRRFPSLPTGLSKLDAILPGGGLPRGKITEITGAPSSGKTTLLYHLMATTARQRDGERRAAPTLAYVDPSHTFHPPSASPLIPFSSLLWILPSSPLEALKTADSLLRTRSLSLLVIDLATTPRALDVVSREGLFRLVRLAQESLTALVFLTSSQAWPKQELPPSGLGSAVALRLHVQRRAYRFVPCARMAQSVCGYRVRVRIAKSKLGRTEDEEEIELLGDLETS